MQRIEATRRQKVLIVCLMLIAIGAAFPLAAPAKTLTLIAYFGTSGLALLLALTRLKALLKPVVISLVMFGGTFLAPVEIAVVRNTQLSVSWVRCEVVGSHFTSPARPADYVIYRGCCPINGVEPSWVLKVCIPGNG